MRHARFSVLLFTAALIALAFICPVRAQTTSPQHGPSNAPAKYFWVNDDANILSKTALYTLTQNAKILQQNNSDQFVTLIIPSLAGWSVEDYARWIGNTWGIGQKGVNNGVLLLVAIKDRRVRIEVGDGLATVLPNSLAKSIIDNEIVPHFKKGEMQAGIIAGHKAIIEALGGKYHPSSFWHNILTLLILPFFLFNRRLRGDFIGGGGSFGGGGASGSW